MPTVKARLYSPADQQQREYERLRYGRVAPATIREVQKRMGAPRAGRAAPPAPTFLEGIYGRHPRPRLTAPGPAFLPHLIALEQLEERRAAAARATPAPSPASPVPPSAAPEPPLETAPVRGLLGW